MDKSLKKFMDFPTKTKARIAEHNKIEIMAEDGSVFSIMHPLEKYNSEDYKNYVLHLIEFIFDRNFSEDREQMIQRIGFDFIKYGVGTLNMYPTEIYQSERVNIGRRIKELREQNNMDARDLALLAGVDASNLSRIEQGKLSTGIDVLARIARILNVHLDLVPNQN